MNGNGLMCVGIATLLSVVLTVPACQPAEKDPKQDAGLTSGDQVMQPSAILELTEQIEERGTAQLYYQRAKAYADAANYEAAINDMKRSMLMDSTNAAHYMFLADLFVESQNGDNALKTAALAIRRFPEDADVRVLAAKLNIYYRKYDMAINHLNEALTIDVFNPQAYFWKGVLFKETGDTSKSISSFQTCVEQDPGNYDAYMQLGLLHRMKKNKFAVNYFNNALSIDPDSEEALYEKGMYFQETGQYALAVKAFRDMVVRHPQNERAHFKVGYNYYQLDSVQKALRSFDRAVQTDPEFKEAFYMKGLCAETLGDMDAAAFNYQQAINLDPGDQLSLEGIKRVKNL